MFTTIFNSNTIILNIITIFGLSSKSGKTRSIFVILTDLYQ